LSPEADVEISGRRPGLALAQLPTSWERFESMDHGANNPTCWLLWAVDYDGNLIVCDEYYASGLISKHAPEIPRRRAAWWQPDGESNACWADPSIFAATASATRAEARPR
jgi:hypothetical protein